MYFSCGNNRNHSTIEKHVKKNYFLKISKVLNAIDYVNYTISMRFSRESNTNPTLNAKHVKKLLLSTHSKFEMELGLMFIFSFN